MKKKKNKKKKKRNVNSPNSYELIFLEFFYDEVDKVHDNHKNSKAQIAGDIDLDVSNMRRTKRKQTNAKMISAMRLVKSPGHLFGEAVLHAERKADEWQKQEDEKKKKKNLM